jgi:hypothetical protein
MSLHVIPSNSPRDRLAPVAEREEIESPGVRAQLAELFRARSFRNGMMSLPDLHHAWRETHPAIPCSVSRLTQMIGRSDKLCLSDDSRVVWVGSHKESLLLQRLRQIILARNTPFPVTATRLQLMRGCDRLAWLEDEDLVMAATHWADTGIDDRGICRSPDLTGELSEELDEIELIVFNLLRKSTMTWSIAEIARKCRKKEDVIAGPLRNSSVICEPAPGYFTTIRTYVH